MTNLVVLVILLLVINNGLILQFGMLHINTAAQADIIYPITFNKNSFPLLQTAWSGDMCVLLKETTLSGAIFIGNVGKGTWFVIGY